jgi:hypothetical protein
VATYPEDSECTCDEPQPPYGHFACALHGWPDVPTEPVDAPATPYIEQETTK